MNVSDLQARWFRLRRSGLHTPFATPEAAASALAGIQAQILPAAALSLWNRTPGLRYADFERLLYEQRSLVKIWGQRGTLHLYTSHEWPLIHGALTLQRTWWERQAAQGGTVATHEALVEQVAALLHERGTLGRSDLRASNLAINAELLSAWGGIFADLVRRGYACHARQSDGEGRFAHRNHWLPMLDWNPPDAETANIELTRRYLHAYGPATVQDLAYWRGTQTSFARRWISALGDAVVAVSVEGQAAFALRSDLEDLALTPPPREEWPVRLLYRFDPLLLGIRDKSWIVEPTSYNRVWRPAGHIEGTILEYGRIAGTWRYDRRGNELLVTLLPFAPLPALVYRAVEQHAAAVAQFFGLRLGDLLVSS